MNFVTFKELQKKLAFLKIAAPAFEGFLNIFLRFQGFSGLFSCKNLSYKKNVCHTIFLYTHNFYSVLFLLLKSQTGVSFKEKKRRLKIPLPVVTKLHQLNSCRKSSGRFKNFYMRRCPTSSIDTTGYHFFLFALSKTKLLDQLQDPVGYK